MEQDVHVKNSIILTLVPIRIVSALGRIGADQEFGGGLVVAGVSPTPKLATKMLWALGTKGLCQKVVLQLHMKESVVSILRVRQLMVSIIPLLLLPT